MKFTCLLMLALGLILVGCSSVPKTQYSKSINLLLPNELQTEQNISNVTIKLSNFDVNKEIMSDKYLKTIIVYYDPWGAYLGNHPVQTRLNIFSGTVPFNVTIINNTDQIIKLEDMRIMYLDPIVDTPVEPYMAIDLATVTQDPSMLQVWNETVRTIQRLNPQNEAYKMQLNSEITGLFKQLKLVNTPKREIMPGMSFSGIIVLPIAREKVTEGRLSFLDVVSKTATPGYATEKVRFDFNVKSVPQYWKFNKAVSPDWVEIPYDEFLLGVQQNN